MCRMEEPVINVKFHHEGQFLKARYANGTTSIVFDVPTDLFSYTVLMEQVKDDLGYSEIGGIYIRNTKAGGWKLLLDDKDLFEYIKGCKSGQTFDFYIDNDINKDIEPIAQMQPHVVVRPKPDLFQGMSFYNFFFK